MRLETLMDTQAEINFVRGVADGLTFGEGAAHRAIVETQPEALVDKVARTLYQAVTRLYSRGEPPELDLIKAELRAMGAISDRVEDWLPYLKQFSEADPLIRPDSMGRRLNELHQRRRAWRVFGMAAENLLDPMQDHAELIQRAAQEALDVMAGGGDEPSPAGDDILAMMERRERFTDDQESAKLAWFGIPSLDEDVRACAGELVIVAARPGKGKTALVVQALAETVQDREWWDEDQQRMVSASGHPCLFVSLELPKKEVHARLASWFTLHRSGKFWAGRYGEGEEHVIRQNKEAMNRLFVWAAPSRTTWSRIEAKIRGAVLRKGVRVVAVDYFGLIGRTGNGKVKPWEEAAELSGKIRSLAQQLGICIILLCQLNREAAEGEPGPEDLRETGALEQDAQTILALYAGKAANVGDDDLPDWAREAGTPTQAPKDTTTWIKVLKNRNGRAGDKFACIFDGAVNRFARATKETR
jgi:replicative DNA helicase